MNHSNPPRGIKESSETSGMVSTAAKKQDKTGLSDRAVKFHEQFAGINENDERGR